MHWIIFFHVPPPVSLSQNTFQGVLICPQKLNLFCRRRCVCVGVGLEQGQIKGGWGVEGGLWPPAPGHMCSVPTSRVFSVLPIFRSNFKNAIFAQMKIQHFDHLSSKLFFPFAFKDTFFFSGVLLAPKAIHFFLHLFQMPRGGGGRGGGGG